LRRERGREGPTVRIRQTVPETVTLKRRNSNWRMISNVSLVTILVLLAEGWVATPAFATFCQIGNISYNYPQQVSPGQTFTTTVAVSGVCAPDDANYYSIRSDLNDLSGSVLSDISVPIGYSQGQNWNVTAQNQVASPTSSASWQIQFTVFIFAAVGSGDIIDSVTYKPVTIQVGTSQVTQTSTATSLTTIQTSAPPVTSITALTSSTVFTQTTDSASIEIYRGLAAVLILVLLSMMGVLVKQRRSRRNV